MSKKKKLIPELRFPEFKNEGEWEYVYGEELFEPISNKNHDSDLPILAITQEQGAIPRDMIDYHVSVSNKSLESYKVVEIGDFIISLRSFQGGIEYSNYLGLCSPAYIVLRKKSNLISDFYKHYFKTFLFIQHLNKNLEGIRDGKMISYSQFSLILIPKPSKNEQEKIADCVSSLDELIATHNTKLELLKDHKKGLMQILFPWGDEKPPKYRFKEFEKDGKWVQKELSEIAIFANEKTSLKNLSFKTYISTENILPDYAGVVSASKLPASGNFTKYKKGDILISNIRPYLKKVWFSDKQGACSNDVFVIRAKSEVDNSFLSFLLKNDNFINYIMIGAKGVKMPRGDKSLISKYIISYPKNKSEQLKISACLSSIDEIITAQTKKIELLKSHKRGLIQNLFPKMND